jgi:hypothetical protein
VFGIDEKQFDPDAATLVDAVASPDGERAAPVPTGNDAAPRGTAAADPPDARVVGSDAVAKDSGPPMSVHDAAQTTDASLPPLPACAATCQPVNVVTVLCIGAIACTYDVCAPFPGGGSYLDCDGNRANGCEASPGDPATCGSCNACQGSHSSCVAKNGRFMCKGGGG